jgi:ABC-2 type transport system ATP-binding protein
LTVPVAGATPRDRTPALRLSGVCKQFGDEVVVEDLSFDVPQGAVVGLVEAGADGEASATAAAMAAGLLPPDEGQVSAFGVDLWDERARARALVGSLPDDLTATQHMDASQALACFGLTRGLDAETVSRRVAALLVGCGLDATRAMPLRD